MHGQDHHLAFFDAGGYRLFAMTARRKTNNEAGFDIDRAKRDLVAWLVREHVISESQVDAWASEWRSAHPARVDSAIDEAAWAVIWDAGFAHIQRHGVEAAVNGVQQERCSSVECRSLAVSLALWELHAYHVEQAGNARAIAADLIELGALIEAAHAGVGAALANKAADETRRFLALAGRVGLPEQTPWLECKQLVDTLGSCARLSNLLAEQVRDGFVSSTLIRARSGPGRPEQTLLTAVWQHLVAGGFNAREAGLLVPDVERIKDESDLMHRVLTRVKTDDCRSFRFQSPTI